MSDRRLYRRKRRFAPIDLGTVAFILCLIVLILATLHIRTSQVAEEGEQALSSAAEPAP